VVPDEPDFALRLAWTVGARRVEVVGELDVATVPAFSAAVRRACTIAPLTEVDLGGVTFFDSQALAALLQLVDMFGDKLQVVSASRSVFRVLDITGTAYLLNRRSSASADAPQQESGRSATELLA